MASQLFKQVSPRAAVSAPRIVTPAASPNSMRFSREGNTPQATSNVKGNPRSGSPQEQAANSAAGLRHKAGNTMGDSGSLAKPVSDPGAAGIGGQEEPQPSQENMKRDPNEPDAKKRERVRQEENKPLDPADK
ncbi:hypothetical protein DL766_007181 [Monosporascus sp. MC13-8B]|uniref:SMP domain-containing protein n=1 Tax=Monosporascus cannonballus TaxID=155416 RepID=A0ABY0GS87_9PEZI|nr:hypothetical protein DL762_009849 [Monosporascus cannonballus]RYO94550.1 hypothetical protein DL763_004057 [Monosporascus cannonballus]RYP24914.1 hypothetical protein DL766_007181 [Monosporascus sp. MC13-8B]